MSEPAEPPSEGIEVTDLVKRFPGSPRGLAALDGVSLSIEPGQLVALIGLSGSGKSTLLRHLNGLVKPTTGQVRVLGTDIVAARRGELRSLRRRVGFVFQQFGLVGRITCMENVLSGALGRLRGPRLGVRSYSRADRLVALENLGRVGLGDQAYQRADTLSGGQQQRVAIARTLMQKPDLLLADEPVASLDPESSAQVMDVLFRICLEDRLTVVCSLHQVELALGWARRIVGLRDGRVVLDQTADGLDQDRVMEVYRRVDPSDSHSSRPEEDGARDPAGV